jgi:hypothetical protein
VTDDPPPAGENNQTLTPAEIQAGIGQEANLDVQTVLGVTWPTPMTFVTVGGSPPFIPSVATRKCIFWLVPVAPTDILNRY